MPAARVISVVALVGVLALCGCGTGESRERVRTPSQEATATVSPSDSDELVAWIEENHGEEPWPASIERVVYTTKLGSPVIELSFSGTTAEARPMAEAAFAALHAESLDIDAWVEAWAEGRQFAGTGLGAPRQRRYPAPPGDVVTLADWLDAVFGPEDREAAAEPWLESIVGIELAESAARRPVIRVKTDLPADGARSADLANLIIVAIARARPTFAGEVEVWYANDLGLLSGSTDTYDPYVY